MWYRFSKMGSDLTYDLLTEKEGPRTGLEEGLGTLLACKNDAAKLTTSKCIQTQDVKDV
jgi:hypothetical protein